MNLVTLYKRDAKNNIIRWQIHELNDGSISIAHGIFAHKPHCEIIKPTLKKVSEFQSRINAKRKEGYKAIEDLYDNAHIMESKPLVEVSDYDKDVYNYLQTYLPKYNTTSEGFVLPMLAKTLEDNKPFEKLGTMLGQWKINGLRCIIGAEKVEGDLFQQVKLTYTSREGTKWNLAWMDQIILPNLSKDLTDMMVEEGVCLDGELYLPGYSVNDINSFVKNPSMPQHYQLQYWCYDICCEDIIASNRYGIIVRGINTASVLLYSKEEHLNNKQQLVVLPTYYIDNITDAIHKRDNFIELGFEGLIVRNQNAEYAFGKRNSSMFKYKKKEDGLFEIVDIKADKRGLPIYTLKNDINGEYFECTINLSQNAQRNQLAMKQLLIGKKGLVEYRERSGVKQVPFHAKLIKIYV